MEFYAAQYDSPVGRLTLASDGTGLVGLWLEGQKYFLETLPQEPLFDREPNILAQTRDWLDRYFSGERPRPQELRLSPVGGEFRRAVWKCLCDIPYGEVTTYQAIARQMAGQSGRAPTSARAVGGAVAHNPISIIIPCHRVVGSNGSLTGYAGGLERKKQLLRLEGVHFFE